NRASDLVSDSVFFSYQRHVDLLN
ncbi:MAG: hypothetical protein QOE76_1661, partial [Frankiales bacterium]|nr:hypothetical protein [Frankiales bacterium]